MHPDKGITPPRLNSQHPLCEISHDLWPSNILKKLSPELDCPTSHFLNISDSIITSVCYDRSSFISFVRQKSWMFQPLVGWFRSHLPPIISKTRLTHRNYMIYSQHNVILMVSLSACYVTENIDYMNVHASKIILFSRLTIDCEVRQCQITGDYESVLKWEMHPIS